MAAEYLLKEDAGKITLEDNSGSILLESSTASTTIPNKVVFLSQAVNRASTY